MRKSETCLILLLIVAAAGGCARYTTPVGPAVKMTPQQRNFEALWQASRKVLRKYRFELDYQDRRGGTILTKPMTGKYAGEFWRRDAAFGDDLAESTLQTIYRQARVTIAPAGQGGQDYHALVEVQVRRSNRQEMQVSSTSEAYSMFKVSGSRGRKARLLDRGQVAPESMVVDLGRDEDLEQLMAIEIRLAAGELRGGL